MKWSLDLGRIAGIRIRVHVTFLLLIALVLWGGGTSPVAELAWIAVVFGCVVVHELSHSLVARRFGVIVRDIVLLPIGGVSEMEALPEDPGQELSIAAAGPLASFAIASVALGACALSSRSAWPPTLFAGSLLARLGWLNVMLGAFNMLPALPLDGGRVLRAALTMKVGRPRATQVAAACGKAGGILLMVAGVTYNIWLLLIGAFVYFGASNEGKVEQTKRVLGALTVADVMVTNPWTAEADLYVGHEALVQACWHQGALPVVSGGRYLGLLGPDRVRTLHQGVPAGALADRFVPTVAATDHLDAALEVFQHSRLAAVAVVRAGGEVEGMLRVADLGAALEYAPVAAAG